MIDNKMGIANLSTGEMKSLQFTSLQYSRGYYTIQGQRYYYNGQTWYLVSGLMMYPLAQYMWPVVPVPSVPTPPLGIGIGDRLKITVLFKYAGPKVTGARIYYAIGSYGALLGFDEKLKGENVVDLPAVTTVPSEPNMTNSYTFTIPTSVGRSWTSIYAKIYGGSPDVPDQLFGYIDALTIIGITPEITEFKISDFNKVA